MLEDRYGNAVSTQSGAALSHYNHALELIHLYSGDPVSALDAALAEDPDFGSAWAARAGLLVQQTDKAYAEEIERSLRAGAAARLTERDRAHLAAARAWAAGRFHDGTASYARIARENPRDVLAVQFAHVSCFFLGLQTDLRDGPMQALRAFSRTEDGYGVLAGMAAFGLEECGDFFRAEVLGREAVSLNPRDCWAVHAVAHVHEMRGDLDSGIPWLADSAEHWSPDSGFAYHNWWHLALLYLDAGNTPEVLRLYDTRVRTNPASQVILESIDASALLWRLFLEGVDTGDRFAPLAAAWARTVEDGNYAFNDLHALMAFIGAGREDLTGRVLKTLQRASNGLGDNAYMARAIGLPLAQGFADFGAGRYRDAAERLLSVRSIAQRFGGSHAQRDILTLTALHAALRGGMKEAAEALAHERVQHKPLSFWAGQLALKAAGLGVKLQLALAS
ncbi:MAG: tetratricopeptide repeat protein [Glycocaulis sp.]